MAYHKSAEKRARQNEKRAERNAGVRSRIKSTVRTFREAVTDGDKQTAASTLSAATKTLYKAASKGVLTKKTAARRVSRLMLAHNKGA